MDELPIICNREPLRPGEVKRQLELFAELRARVSEIRELSSGYSFRFPADALQRLAELMEIERRCCAFLRLRLEAKSRESDVWLTVEGPEGSKDVVRAELQLFS